MPLLTIARLTLFETLRRRLVLIAAVLTLVVIAMTGWGFSKLASATVNGAPITHDEIVSSASALTIVIAYMFSFVLAIAASFLAAPSIATDVESGLVLAILPRPIRRLDFVVGKWLALSALIACYAAGAGALELWIVRLATGYTPPHPFLTLLYMVGECLALLSLALLASTRLAPIAGGIIAVVLFGMEWIIGIAAAIGTGLGNVALENAGTVASLVLPTDGLWRGALYNLEPAAYAALATAGTAERANPFAVGAPPTTAYIIWGIIWIAAVVGLAGWSFARRDL